jgi:uracil-DNA glycosylase
VLTDLEALFAQIRACTLCAPHLPNDPRPVVRGSSRSSILIVGQAPGRRVHETGIPFNDPSGDRLRDWMGIDRKTFYDESRIALLPMGFCYPGTGESGDLPPRPECATAWRDRLLAALPKIELTLLVGQYAIAWHLYPDRSRPPTVTETVKKWRDWWPGLVPLPHPSPRNNLWLRRNPWFAEEVLPQLKQRVATVLAQAL